MKKSKVVGEVNASAGAADGFAALPTAEVCKNARLSRDPRFDGRFVVAVLSTGVFCRPTCPARRPAEHNVRYFVTAAAAAEAGYRPCKRCQPEMALVTPEWVLRNPHLGRALRFIDEGCSLISSLLMPLSFINSVDLLLTLCCSSLLSFSLFLGRFRHDL